MSGPQVTVPIGVLSTSIRIASSAPAEPHATSHAALIPWSLITELRSELAAGGIDWWLPLNRAGRSDSRFCCVQHVQGVTTPCDRIKGHDGRHSWELDNA